MPVPFSHGSIKDRMPQEYQAKELDEELDASKVLADIQSMREDFINSISKKDLSTQLNQIKSGILPQTAAEDDSRHPSLSPSRRSHVQLLNTLDLVPTERLRI